MKEKVYVLDTNVILQNIQNRLRFYIVWWRKAN
jgi:hypothetical protein